MSVEKRDPPVGIKWIEVTPERAKGFLGSFKVTEAKKATRNQRLLMEKNGYSSLNFRVVTESSDCLKIIKNESKNEKEIIIIWK